MHFNEELRRLIPPRNQSDRTGMSNTARWLAEQIDKGVFDENVFERVLGYAREAQDGRNPAALFVSLLKKELGFGRVNAQHAFRQRSTE